MDGQSGGDAAHLGTGGAVVVEGAGVDGGGGALILDGHVQPLAGLAGGEAVVAGQTQVDPAGILNQHDVGVEGFAGVALDADAVGVGGPLVGGGQGVGIHDDDVVQVLLLLDVLIVTGVANLIHNFLVHEQGGNPLGGAGLQQGHGQHVPGGGGGAVEYQIHDQRQAHHQQNDDGEQRQEEPADNAPQQTALLFFLLFLTHFRYLAEVVFYGLQRPSAAGSNS